VIPALTTTAVTNPAEPAQQVRTADRDIGKPITTLGIGHDTTDRRRAGLGDGRMHQQRSSGYRRRSVEGRSSYRSFVALPPRHADDHRPPPHGRHITTRRSWNGR